MLRVLYCYLIKEYPVELMFVKTPQGKVEHSFSHVVRGFFSGYSGFSSSPKANPSTLEAFLVSCAP